MLALIFSLHILIVVWLCSKYQAHRALLVLLLTAIPYFLAASIDIFFFENSNNYELNNVIQSSFLCLLVMVATIFFYYVFSAFPALRIVRGNFFGEPKLFVFVGVVLISFTLVGVMGRSLLSAADSGRAEFYQSKPLLYDLFRMLGYSAILLYVGKMYRKPSIAWVWVFLMLALTFMIDVLLIGDRRIWISVFLFVILLFSTTSKMGPATIISTIVPLALLLMVIGGTRAGGEASVNTNISRMEFGYFEKISAACSLYDCSALEGTFRGIPEQLMPSFVVSDRPTPPTSTFANMYDRNYADSGGTYAYNLLLDFEKNGGILGLLLLSILLGGVASSFSKSMNRSRPIPVLILAIFISLLFFPRMDFISVLKQFEVWLVMMAVVMLLNSCWGSITKYVR